MVFIHDLLGRNTLPEGFDSYRNPVFVGSPDENDILPVHPEETDKNICRYIYPRQVSYMNGTIGIGKC